MRSGKLDEGDQEGEGPGLPDAGENVEADLRVIHAGCYYTVANGSVAYLSALRRWCCEGQETQGVGKAYTTRNTRKVKMRGDLRSLNLVAYNVNGMEKNSVVRLNASWRIEIFQEVVSNPRLSTI